MTAAMSADEARQLAGEAYQRRMADKLAKIESDIRKNAECGWTLLSLASIHPEHERVLKSRGFVVQHNVEVFSRREQKHIRVVHVTW